LQGGEVFETAEKTSKMDERTAKTKRVESPELVLHQEYTTRTSYYPPALIEAENN